MDETEKKGNMSSVFEEKKTGKMYSRKVTKKSTGNIRKLKKRQKLGSMREDPQTLTAVSNE